MSIRIAAENFAESEDFANAIVMSTMAGISGSGYSVELFPDGHYRILWNNQINSLYKSPGIILRIPQLTEKELEDSDINEAADLYASEWKNEFLDCFYEA